MGGTAFALKKDLADEAYNDMQKSLVDIEVSATASCLDSAGGRKARVGQRGGLCVWFGDDSDTFWEWFSHSFVNFPLAGCALTAPVH